MIELPIPPSVNELYDGGVKTKRRFKSNAYTEWLHTAGWRLTQQNPERHTGRVKVLYEYGRYNDNRRRDVCNFEKAISDLLVAHGVIEDDHLIDHVTLCWSDEVPEGLVHVSIEVI